ncbi:MAG TPA: hypothetical protein GXX37_12145 [Clostridiaceae bacterium]|nr:hypothetical protein [Clostridiaceae bacterium]
MNYRKSYNADAREAAFLLGGIGTGNFSIGARGEMRDWEIFNRPGKGNIMPYTFFAIWAKKEDAVPVVKVLESKLQPPYSKSHGFAPEELGGLPRLDSSVMIGEYPFVWVEFKDRKLPVQVTLEAFTPFIPLNEDESGIPGAIIRYKVKNPTSKKVNVTIVGSMSNVIGTGVGNPWRTNLKAKDKKIEYICKEGLHGLYYTAVGIDPEALNYGNMALITSDNNVTVKPNWLNRGWWDGIHDFWDDFSSDGMLEKESIYVQENVDDEERFKVGSLGIYHVLLPNEEKIFEFILTWYFPNRVKSWYEDQYIFPDWDGSLVKNYYSKMFQDAWDVGQYLKTNMDRLEKHSRDFHRALFTSTLPYYVIDAIASNITVIRSPTCFRIETGEFLSYEGCHDSRGSCQGNCTHVWNYAQTLAFLFPKLEQTMRKIEFNLETDENGKMAFRTHQVLGQKRWDYHPAADGQMGTIIRLYRDWKLSGDDEFLKEVWNNACKALDFAFSYWDSDGDFVLDSQQHNTYDIEFYGPNSLTNSMFFAALKAGTEMAEYLGDRERAAKYKQALEKGSNKMDQLLWNGEYYIQKIDDINRYRYQYGEGCLSDQLLGQLLAHVAGLGYVLPKEHVRKAVYSIFKYNFRSSLEEHYNVQRTYALGNEKGLLLCSWPHGGRPKLPFVYSDEVWSGIEYQVAAHLIYEGFIDEGLTIVKAVRERYDGYKRNPWNEVECGHHYVRSMASWSVLLALSGFKYDMVKGTMSFAPAINQDNFRTFWSTGRAWGIYRQIKDQEGKIHSEIEILYGSLEGIKIIMDT